MQIERRVKLLRSAFEGVLAYPLSSVFSFFSPGIYTRSFESSAAYMKDQNN